MLERKVMGLKEAQIAVEAMIKEIPKGDSRPISICVMDHEASILMMVKTDGAHEFNNRMAIRKAYSSAHWRRSTRALEEMSGRLKWPLQEFGSEWTMVYGGEPIIDPKDGTAYGAIGVAGRIPAADDEAIAKVGVKAILDTL